MRVTEPAQFLSELEDSQDMEHLLKVIELDQTNKALLSLMLEKNDCKSKSWKDLAENVRCIFDGAAVARKRVDTLIKELPNNEIEDIQTVNETTLVE